MDKKLSVLCNVTGILCYGYLLFSVTFDFDTKNNIIFSTSSIIFLYLGIEGLRHDEK